MRKLGMEKFGLLLAAGVACHQPITTEFCPLGAPPASVLTDKGFDRSTCSKKQLGQLGHQHAETAIELTNILQECFQGIDTAAQECSDVDMFVNGRGITALLGNYDQTTVKMVPSAADSFECCMDGAWTYALANDYAFDTETSDPDGRWTYWCNEDKGAGRDCIQLREVPAPEFGSDFSNDPSWSGCEIAIVHQGTKFIGSGVDF